VVSSARWETKPSGEKEKNKILPRCGTTFIVITSISFVPFCVDNGHNYLLVRKVLKAAGSTLPKTQLFQFHTRLFETNQFRKFVSDLWTDRGLKLISGLGTTQNRRRTPSRPPGLRNTQFNCCLFLLSNKDIGLRDPPVCFITAGPITKLFA
jgi:hypothetical protein